MNDDVLHQAQRLGASFEAPMLEDDEKQVEGHPIPEPMLEFLFGLAWPKRRRYASAEESGLWVWHVDLNLFDWIDPEQLVVADRGERPLICFGEAGGGNDILAMALDDPDPSDPWVYKLDHDDPDLTLRRRLKLSEFLAQLEPEDE